MGQALSTPEPALGVKEYINLPKEAIEALWYFVFSTHNK
jgi:hypothetical protein